MSKPDLSTYGGLLREQGYTGQLADSNPQSIFSFTNTGSAAIDFGAAVARDSTHRSCKAVDNVANDILGIAVRHAIYPADANGDVKFAQYASVPVLEIGRIFAYTHENVTEGDKVVALIAQGGKLGSYANNTAGTAGEVTFAGTGNGVLTMDATTPVLSGAKNGNYTVTCITAATDGGVFRVEDPDGDVLGDVAVGDTFADDIKFAIADGSTDFTVGAKFTIPVTVGAGRVLVPGATWEQTVSAQGVGLLRISLVKI